MFDVVGMLKHSLQVTHAVQWNSNAPGQALVACSAGLKTALPIPEWLEKSIANSNSKARYINATYCKYNHVIHAHQTQDRFQGQAAKEKDHSPDIAGVKKKPHSVGTPAMMGKISADNSAQQAPH